jgi:hypothetical protein
MPFGAFDLHDAAIMHHDLDEAEIERFHFFRYERQPVGIRRNVWSGDRFTLASGAGYRIWVRHSVIGIIYT